MTYGTNSEFGFDYLRDNGLAGSKEERVQRGHFYAIVDEVDSILIDEARTPLIISGPASVSTHVYDKLKPVVSELVRKQTLLCNRLLKEAKDQFDAEGLTDKNEETIGTKLFLVSIGTPKNKQLAKLVEEPKIRRLMDTMDLQLHSDLRKDDMAKLKEDLFFVIEEKQHTVDLTEKGRDAISPGKPEEYLMPDMIVLHQQIDADESLSAEQKELKKQELQVFFDRLTERIHNMSQLLRAYTLFEKDVEYVVQDNRVMIVDEFTGRLMPGRRYSDGLHQALEAKEEVEIERETQTFATITIQNYFRMYKKLAGMTGTAETEANEFHQIYKLDVVVIPTNRAVRRLDYNDVIYKTKREKYNAIIQEIAENYSKGRPVLVGTVTVDVSEVLSRMLKRQGIPHNVLNAKYHQKEAEIISLAGQRHAVTIATNMAGRGTDIKLGEGVVQCPKCCIRCADDCAGCPTGTKKVECLKCAQCGLYVIGTERHEARRIDRQLRGRCARQGDAGSSKFYISLEDDLMRLFGSDRIARVMERIGMEEGQDLVHPLLTRSIETAQRRVEERNFSIRKHTLEYDDVMNKQREVIYAYRSQVLENENLKELLDEMVDEVIDAKLDEYMPEKSHTADWDTAGLTGWFNQTFMSVLKIGDDEQLSRAEVKDRLAETVKQTYALKEKFEGPEMILRLMQYVMLTTIDKVWMEHLYNMDSLREGIGLRAYGQTDPLIAYKQEAYGMFAEMMGTVKSDIVAMFFRASIYAAREERQRREVHQQLIHETVSAFAAPPAGAAAEQRVPDGMPMGRLSEQEGAKLTPYKRDTTKVGRNDPCPCGSGKKYKKCCGVSADN
ncbi:MAG TPA: preprotein translocase subunit SecA [bacterium]|nr:preprotein translocase subunit SecA [bacterium]